VLFKCTSTLSGERSTEGMCSELRVHVREGGGGQEIPTHPFQLVTGLQRKGNISKIRVNVLGANSACARGVGGCHEISTCPSQLLTGQQRKGTVFGGYKSTAAGVHEEGVYVGGGGIARWVGGVQKEPLLQNEGRAVVLQ
jgi:hypothetical protein